MYAYTQSIFLVYFAFFLLLVFCSLKAPFSDETVPCKESFLVTFLISVFVNFHNGGKCHRLPKCSKLHYEPLGSLQN